MKNINSILKEILKKIEPTNDDIRKIKYSLEGFLKKTKKKIRAMKIFAEVFVGGSFAKGTIIKKDHYDIDIFIRFDKRYKNDELSKLTERILKPMNFTKIHGSRDYFKTEVSKGIFFEIIPVKKVRNPKEAENITDLSFFHVNYIKKKIKSKKTLDEIRLTKAFCYANNCYGAESYVSGFSGYGLELLIYHYKSFMNFIKSMAKDTKKEVNNKVIIDIERYYKNKAQVLLDINSAKLQSPIILIDPTYKQRNVLAALSEETLRKFKESCKKFLKNPDIKAFEVKKIDFEAIKENAKNKRYEFILLEAKTDRQEGDIAGSKLLKFYKHLAEEIGKYFEVKGRGFEYLKGKSARFFFVVGRNKEILVQGPSLKQEEHVKKFRNKYKKIFIKNDRLYTKYKINLTLRQFIENWRQKNKKIISDMAIRELGVSG
mgnify:FL=1